MKFLGFYQRRRFREAYTELIQLYVFFGFADIFCVFEVNLSAECHFAKMGNEAEKQVLFCCDLFSSTFAAENEETVIELDVDFWENLHWVRLLIALKRSL